MKKTRIISIFFASIFCFGFQSGSMKKEESFDCDKKLAEQFGYDYFSSDTMKKLENDSIVATENISGYTKKYSIRKKNNSDTKRKSANSDGTIANADIEYLDDDHISSIRTDNQTIAFAYDEELNLQSASLNGNRLLGIEDGLMSYANGDTAVRSLDFDSYTFSSRSRNYRISVNQSQQPSSVKDVQHDITTDYGYDENEILTDREVKSRNLSFHWDESQLDYHIGNESMTETFDDGKIEIAVDGKSFSYRTVSDADSRKIFFGNELLLEETTTQSDGAITVSGTDSKNTYQYTYDEDKRLTGKNIAGSLESYGYDEIGRLVSVTSPSGNCLYDYDSSSNVVTASGNENHVLLYENENDTNQLTSFDRDALTYDGFGNLTSFRGDSFSWSNGSTLMGVSTSTDSLSFEYDVDGIRTKKESLRDGTCEYHYFDGNLMAVESDAFGLVRYFYDEEKTPIGFYYDDELYLFVHDHCGCITSILDSSMNPVVEYVYSPWGEPSISDISGNRLSEANVLLYKDYVYDSETDLYYLESRYYSPLLMHFISRDNLERIAKEGSKDIFFNLYGYANNNPIVYSDPTGFDILSTGAIAAGITGFIIRLAFTVCVYIVSKMIFDYMRSTSSLSLDARTTINDTKDEFWDFVKATKNEIKKGIVEALRSLWKWWRKEKEEIHHIIAQASIRAIPARNVWVNKCGKNINDPINLVALKYSIHRRLHTQFYYSIINIVICKAYDSGLVAGTEAVLKEINLLLAVLNTKENI